MSQNDDDVRELLRRKAEQVRAHHEVPRSLVRRARRRIAVNALGSGVLALAIAAGVFAGVRALQHQGGAPGGFVGQPSASASPSSCTPGQLRAVGSMQGAAGSREGTIRLTNFSNATCTVQGTPAITLLDQSVHPITTGVRFSSSPAGWQADGLAKPAGWPVVTLAPFDSASVRVRWGNWCPDGRAAPLWRMDFNKGTVNVNGLDALGPPPCNGPGKPSTIEVGPFEPSNERG